MEIPLPYNRFLSRVHAPPGPVTSVGLRLRPLNSICGNFTLLNIIKTPLTADLEKSYFYSERSETARFKKPKNVKRLYAAYHDLHSISCCKHSAMSG